MIDMTTLKNYDQTGDMNARLVNHLKSDDFFSVEKFPTATLKITKVDTQAGQTMITGDLTIKGITKPVTFPAEVKVDGKKLTAKGDMTVDRTMYDIKFRSLKFFSDIGDKVIKDDFTVSFDLVATK
jgi:polyisoprenoid-binding protein YceI